MCCRGISCGTRPRFWLCHRRPSPACARSTSAGRRFQSASTGPRPTWACVIFNLLGGLGEAASGSFVSLVRKALAEDSQRVHASLAALADLDFGGCSGDPGFEQWKAWADLQRQGAIDLKEGVSLTDVGAAWHSLVRDLDTRSWFRAFEACTMVSLRKSLRRGGGWLHHSLSFRQRDQMLIPPADWAVQRDGQVGLRGMPKSAAEFLEPLLATAALADQAGPLPRARLSTASSAACSCRACCWRWMPPPATARRCNASHRGHARTRRRRPPAACQCACRRIPGPYPHRRTLGRRGQGIRRQGVAGRVPPPVERAGRSAPTDLRRRPVHPCARPMGHRLRPAHRVNERQTAFGFPCWRSTRTATRTRR